MKNLKTYKFKRGSVYNKTKNRYQQYPDPEEVEVVAHSEQEALNRLKACTKGTTKFSILEISAFVHSADFVKGKEVIYNNSYVKISDR